MRPRTSRLGLLAAALLACTVVVPSRAQEAKREELSSRTYSVADLIAPRRNTTEQPRCKDQCKQPNTKHKELIDLIVMSVAPGSWMGMGGEGTIQFFPLGLALVVNQTQEVHEEVSALLAALRRLQEVDVAVELKFVTISEKTLQDLGSYLNLPACLEINQPLGFLTHEQFLDFMKKAETDARLNVMQAPKLTIPNGESAGFKVGDQQRFLTGVEVTSENGKIVVRPKTETVDTNTVQCHFAPVVSADRKHVYLSMNVQVSTLERTVESVPITVPITQHRPDGIDELIPVTLNLQKAEVDQRSIQWTISIPNARAVVVYGGVTHSAGSEEDPVHLLVLVTPRILVGGAGEAPIPRP